MSREKEIIEAGINYTMKNRPNMLAGDMFSEEMREYNRNKAFEEGAKWADKTMIDKACEWLKFHVSIPCEIETTDAPAKEYLNWAKKRLEAAEEICNDFRKAMEE
jgi:hypothetical protein